MADNQFDAEFWSEYAQAAQGGDKKAYNKLLTGIAPYIRNILAKSLSNQDAIDDVVQEVLISVHKSLKTYNPERPFKPWLYSIISFRRTDYLRKYYAGRDNKTAPLEHADFSDFGVTNTNHSGEYKDIEAALAQLPEQQRRIFTMIKIEGYTAQEVANEMDMKESAVKVSAHRTMKKLKGLLE
ncbi:MAG: RNA polymerase sigma factor [Pseudomonadota bacterium]